MLQDITISVIHSRSLVKIINYEVATKTTLS